ncbi:MAG: hypothetical protein AAF702_38705 [Chloroflexota bacterium]
MREETTLANAGCTPNTIFTVLVMAGIILIMLAGISGNRPISNPTIIDENTLVVETPVTNPAPNPVSPLSLPLQPANSAAQPQNAVQGASVVDPSSCWDGCLIDGLCGDGPSIIARANPTTNTRYYYPANHPSYAAFRTADTLGQTNFFFCEPARAEANGWQRAPE